MVEPLPCLGKIGFVSSCLRNILLVERGKVNTVVQVTSNLFGSDIQFYLCVSTEDESADKMGI